MENELKPCKWGKCPKVFRKYQACAVVCECGEQTPLYFSKQAAIDAWNKRS